MEDECHKDVRQEALCPGYVMAVIHGPQGNIDETEVLTQSL